MSNNNRTTGLSRIRLRLHYTWIIAFILMGIIVYTQFPESYIMWKRLVLGGVTSLIFLVIMVIRQTAIDLLAVSRRIPLRRVTLYVFGGVPGIYRDFTSPLVEMLLGFAGILFSLLSVVVLYFVYVALVITNISIMGSLIEWLAFIMVMFTFFHFIPAFPLDGGRVLRAFIWRATGDYDRATLITSRLGQIVGWVGITGGIFIIFSGHQWPIGCTLILIGWVLFGVAARTARMTILRQILRKTNVDDIVTPCAQVNPQLNIEKLVNDYIVGHGHSYLIVTDSDKMIGNIELSGIKTIPKKQWREKTISQYMLPVDKIDYANIGQSAADALERMYEQEIPVMPVLDGDRPIGVISLDYLVRLGKIRGELRM